MGAGNLSLPGTLDVRKDVASAAFQPRLENVEIGTILKAFNYPIALTGQLSLAGISLARRLMRMPSVVAGRGRRTLS